MFTECTKTDDGEDTAHGCTVDGAASNQDVCRSKNSQGAHVEQGNWQTIQNDEVRNQTTGMAVDAADGFFVIQHKPSSCH